MEFLSPELGLCCHCCLFQYSNKVLVFFVNFRQVPIIEAPVLPVSRKRKSLEQEKDTEQEKKPVSNRVPNERLYLYCT